MAVTIKIHAEDVTKKDVQKVEASLNKLQGSIGRFTTNANRRFGRLSGTFTRMRIMARGAFDKIAAFGKRAFSRLAALAKKFIIGGVVAAFVALNVAIFKSIKMSTAQEEIFKRLETAVGLAGVSYEGAKDRIMGFLGSMQATTRFGDTDLAPALQQITILTGSLEKGFEGAKIAADIASTGLFDLNTASRYVAMAMAGEVTMLGRYIPQLKEAALKQAGVTTTAGKTAYALALLREKFGGAAQKDLDTFGGRLKQLKNYLGDVMERIGDLIAVRLKPKIEGWISSIQAWIDQGGLEEFAKNLSTIFSGAEKAISGFAVGINKVVAFAAEQKVKNLNTEIQAVETNIKKLTDPTGLDLISYKLNSAFGHDRQEELTGYKNRLSELKETLEGLSKPAIDLSKNIGGSVNEIKNKIAELQTVLKDQKQALEDISQAEPFGNMAAVQKDLQTKIEGTTGKIIELQEQLKGLTDKPVKIGIELPGVPTIGMEPRTKTGTELEEAWRGRGKERTEITGATLVTSIESASDKTEDFTDKWEDASEGMKLTANVLQDSFSSAFDVIGSGLKSMLGLMIKESDSAFKRIAKSFLGSMLDALTKIAAKAAVSGILGMIFPAFGFTKFFGFQKGGLVTHEGIKPLSFQKGGVVPAFGENKSIQTVLQPLSFQKGGIVPALSEGVQGFQRGGVVPAFGENKTIPTILQPKNFMTYQTGGRIPGYGGGDRVPALLEPGELIIPKEIVPAVETKLKERTVTKQTTIQVTLAPNIQMLDTRDFERFIKDDAVPLIEDAVRKGQSKIMISED